MQEYPLVRCFAKDAFKNINPVRYTGKIEHGDQIILGNNTFYTPLKCSQYTFTIHIHVLQVEKSFSKENGLTQYIV